tara:strand:+ start:1618 stop:2238 length:621 start_codon:yes stop_codon:yes gene_type:complete
MIERKKKLRIIQLTLLIFGIIIIYITYYGKNQNREEQIISKTTKEKIQKNVLNDKSQKGDIFFDVEYTGLDLTGNRYLLKSKEAYLDNLFPEKVYMKGVNAVFYFKDDTILYVSSNKGVYNNKTLDMKFENNVNAKYQASELFAERAEYSNSESFLSIYEKVRINDIKGNLVADKLQFDITKEELNITSFNDGKINANVNLNEKRF